jgi:hypothetical protein
VRTVYVCHPYAGDPEENVRRVRRIARRIVQEGNLPMAPHLYFPAFMSEKESRETILDMCRKMVLLVDEIRVYGEPTEGMAAEIREAKIYGKEIRVLTRTGKEV